MRSSICKIEGCANKPIARGWCNTHYRRFRRYGDPLKTVRKPVKEMSCTVENYQSNAYSTEMCRPHYEKNRLYGDTNYERVLVRDQACSIEGCENNIHARDLCNMHYSRLRTNGDPLALRQFNDPEEAFQARTEWQGDCLVWLGEVSKTGYGRLYAHGIRKLAHRYAWERAYGEIAEGMTVDHICHNTSCVNVDHLRLGTYGQNNSNMSGPIWSSSSGVRNVHKYEGRWRVNVMKDGKSNYFGVFDTVEEAAVVAKKARQEMFGDFAGRG